MAARKKEAKYPCLSVELHSYLTKLWKGALYWHMDLFISLKNLTVSVEWQSRVFIWSPRQQGPKTFSRISKYSIYYFSVKSVITLQREDMNCSVKHIMKWRIWLNNVINSGEHEYVLSLQILTNNKLAHYICIYYTHFINTISPLSKSLVSFISMLPWRMMNGIVPWSMYLKFFHEQIHTKINGNRKMMSI